MSPTRRWEDSYLIGGPESRVRGVRDQHPGYQIGILFAKTVAASCARVCWATVPDMLCSRSKLHNWALVPLCDRVSSGSYK